MSGDSIEPPSPVKVASMAGDQEEQSMPTRSASMAGSKATHCLKSPPADLVKLFQTQNLQDGINRVLQQQKPCHSNQTFVPHKKSQILGPYFVSHPPTSLASIYPQPKEHLLPFQVKPDWSKWVRSFGAWPAWRKSELTDWINRLEPAFGQIWRDAGLFEFIQLTKCKFIMDKPFLNRIALHWRKISALLTLPPSVEYHAELKPSYPAFVRSAYDKSLTKEFIPLAVALAHGKQLALGPFLLAHLYRSCQDITAHPLVISGGPLWVLQLWLYSYFPALAPVSSAVPARDLLTYGFMFKNAMENKRSFEEQISRSFMFEHSQLQMWRGALCTESVLPAARTLILPDPPFRPNCTSSYRSWWRDYFHPRFLSAMDNISALAPPPLTKKLEEKKVVKESEDLESAMAAQISKPDLPRRAPKTQVKRKIATPADSTKEITPSKQRRTGGIKRSAVKPSAAKKLIKSTSPSRSTSITETEIQPDKTEGVSLGPTATTDPVEDISAESGESNSDSSRTNSGDGSSAATKVRGSRFFSHMANKSFKIVRPNELINLSPDKENIPTPIASPVRHVHVNDIESVAADVLMIDDDLEDELLAQLDMLMDPPVKSGSATDNKGKAVAEEANFDINLPTQEQISFAIMIMQELLDGDPSHFCKVPDQPAAFEAAQILSRAPQLSSTQQKFWADFTTIYTHFSKRFPVLESKIAAAASVRKSVADSTVVVFKKKEEFLAAKEAHVTQVKHLQELKEEISNLEAKLSELRNQVPLAKQTEKSLAEQRNKLDADMEAGLKSTAKIKDQLPPFTASSDEAAEEIKNMREEWSTWQNNLC
ncbi:hypothetical protein SLEP1_g52357 [Rubroshorea leprosula]|uniref:Aminotransferase-like plant mobile domain-containing protein n=1 Tax=Rubroshorea leprosula TaxID=152421 RepID=A0AAV5M5Z3_9ROSI|nr:hypothetical protein SLEP1_g52357 [Rubroshorea leprosula]